MIAAFGAFLIALGIVSFLIQICVSILKREALRDLTGDPWDGRTLEWSTASPPPAYNFAFTPVIHDNDTWWDMKRRGYQRPLLGFRPIHMPRNTGAGIILAGFSLVLRLRLDLVHLVAGRDQLRGAARLPPSATPSTIDRDFHIAADEVVRDGSRADRASQPGGGAMNVINTTAFAEAEVPVFYLADEHEHPEGASTMLGFWIYLMSDCLIFAVLFATYGVLGGNYAAGPAPKDLFELPLVALNTSMLLMSSITYGFAMLTMDKGQVRATQLWLAVTGLFGLAFVGIELSEFAHLIHEGATPQRSAFLSSFFTLVGTHGLHVTCGLIWLVTLMIQVGRRGLIEANRRRLMCLSLFWHFLDVIWIGVFTFVYLMGMLR